MGVFCAAVLCKVVTRCRNRHVVCRNSVMVSVRTMDALYCVWWVLLGTVIITQVSHTVEITSFKVPPVIQNGSRDSLVLDCNYSYEEAEKEGLVVKYFINGGHKPVYQWIPNLNRTQELGILKGRLDLGFKVSDDPYKMHRALNIVNPTIELSGLYKCKVSTFEDEDSIIKKMIVYAPPKAMFLTANRTVGGLVNVSCWVYGVYPKPELVLHSETWDGRRLELSGTKVASLRDTAARGAYNVTVYKLLEEKDLLKHNVFHCILRIPGTWYEAYREVEYISNDPSPSTDSSHSAGKKNKDMAAYSVKDVGCHSVLPAGGVVLLMVLVSVVIL